jgi:hypothetical protein
VARLWTGWLVTATLLGSAPALGGLWEDLYRGLDIYATPTGYPVQVAPGGGQVNGNRFGRLRVVPNELGEGYRLELDRNFGVDTRGRPEVYDLGNFELQLSGATQATLGFTRRGILTGNADIFAGNLNYALRGKSGGQDFELTGLLNVANRLEVNRLGFYTLQLEINNTNSSLTADGVLVDGEQDTDFDVGPITIQGNVFYDVALAVLTSFGVDAPQLEGVFPASPIDRINDEIQAALSEQTLVLGEMLAGDLNGGELSSMGVVESGYSVGDAGRVLEAPRTEGLPVPESATLLLLGVLGLVVFRRRA